MNRFALGLLLLGKALVTPVAFGVAAIASDRDGRILLVKHTYQKGWLLPGGGVGRGEAPEDAVLRELKEEVGYVKSRAPEFLRLFTRRVGLATNVIVVYRVEDIEIAFRPNLEIREAIFVTPDNLPPDTTAPTRRRIEEMLGRCPHTAHW